MYGHPYHTFFWKNLLPSFLGFLGIKNAQIQSKIPRKAGQKHQEGGKGGGAVAPQMFSRTTFLIFLIPA